MRSRGLLESTPASKRNGGGVLKVTRREEDGDNFASSSVTFRILVLLVGVFCGFVLSSHASSGSVHKLHNNVKKAYQAHNEAKQEYLKRYRESYLETVLGGAAQKQEEGRGEEGGDEAVAEVLATMSELAEEQIENSKSGESDGEVLATMSELAEEQIENSKSGESDGEVLATMSELAEEQIENSKSGESDGDGSTAVKELPERVEQKGNQRSQQPRRGNVHLYVLQHISDCGLGHLMEQFGNIYEICDELGIGSVTIRECGTRMKPWHSHANIPCEPNLRKKKNVVMYGKRSSEIDVSLGPNEETDDMDGFVHIDGQKVDWIQELESMTNPETPRKVFLTQPHNKFLAESRFSAVTKDNSCAAITKWFGDPSDFLLDELERNRIMQQPAKKPHQNEISFHFRLLDHEDYGIEVQSDLSIKIGTREVQLGDPRLDGQEDGYGLLKNLDLKKAVHSVIELANKLYETSGMTTFVASDAPAIRAYLRDNPAIALIEHGGGETGKDEGGEIADNRDLKDTHYSLTSALELYELGAAKTIISFPFSSGFSRAASCLIEGSEYKVVKSVAELEKVIRDHVN
jgi:hypothetical protein